MVATRRNTGSATFFMILLNDAGASGPTYTLEDWRWWEATGGATAFPTLRMNPEAENKDPGATWAELTGAAATDVPDRESTVLLDETQNLASATDTEGLPDRMIDRIDRSKRDIEDLLSAMIRGDSPARSAGYLELCGRVADVTEGGRAWVEIELTLKVIAGDRQERMRFRVDPATKLPHSVVFESREGQGTTLFDYPDRGPSSIYDLGAPRTAKIVDRVPADDLDRVLAGLKAGRVRFDDYRGIEDWGDGMNVKRIWRKGRKWRAETLLPAAGGPPDFPRNADAAWWRKHQDDYESMVQAICDGERVYYYRAEGNAFAPDAKRPIRMKLNMTQEINPSDDPFMPWPDSFPEHISHPSVWQPSHDREMLLDAHPTDGPPGTIRLRVRDTRGSEPGRPDLYKLWISPALSYMAVRSETSVFEGGGSPMKLAYVDTRVLEGFLQAPSGAWYPTRVRRKTTQFPTEQVWTFHLEFDVPIPDELFRPLE